MENHATGFPINSTNNALSGKQKFTKSMLTCSSVVTILHRADAIRR